MGEEPFVGWIERSDDPRQAAVAGSAGSAPGFSPGLTHPTGGRSSAAAFALGAALGFAALAGLAFCPWGGAGAQQAADDLASLKPRFARPAFVPSPSHNPPTPAKIALGKRIFSDPALSATGTISCASCHDPKLAFTDGEPTGKGVTGRRLARHTPSLWNLAWSPLLFWDGRAATLEDQIRFPIEHPDEMGSTLDNAVDRFSRHDSYVRAFADAFPGDPRITPANIARALAAYERTLVSPPTRFDRWLAGDAAALSAGEINGLRLFAGRAKCINCHKGFAFTDYNFYDIGVPSDDRGRGAEIRLPAADYAFKTPTLRELVWTAPYMHDGSLATLDDVVRIYEMGGVSRPTRAKDLPATIKLWDGERADLIAFLESLSSDAPPQPSREAWVSAAPQMAKPRPVSATVVSQIDKLFSPSTIRIRAEQPLTILNDDTRTHNVRVFDPRFDYNSGAQEPNESISIRFPVRGTFEAFCSIHPTMRLTVMVE
jgi:cytochrome c peroxidase